MISQNDKVRFYVRDAHWTLLALTDRPCRTSTTHQSEYLQGWFLTILDVAFEYPAPKVGHLKSP